LQFLAEKNSRTRERRCALKALSRGAGRALSFTEANYMATTAPAVTIEAGQDVIDETRTWPMEIRALVSMVRKPGKPVQSCRRRWPRTPFLVKARIWRGDKPDMAQPITIYTLDMNPYAIAFIAPTAFAPGAPTVIEFHKPDGSPYLMNFTIYRCRQFQEGWFEAVVNRRK
jgi:hypothetical protein